MICDSTLSWVSKHTPKFLTLLDGFIVVSPIDIPFDLNLETWRGVKDLIRLNDVYMLSAWVSNLRWITPRCFKQLVWWIIEKHVWKERILGKPGNPEKQIFVTRHQIIHPVYMTAHVQKCHFGSQTKALICKCSGARASEHQYKWMRLTPLGSDWPGSVFMQLKSTTSDTEAGNWHNQNQITMIEENKHREILLAHVLHNNNHSDC